MFKRITDDLDAMLERLPPHIAQPLREREDRSELLEVVMDLGRLPEARYPDREIVLGDKEVDEEDIEYIVSRIATFGG
ncbi:MAG: AAA family ATPase, partial [Dehalococcoidia bacterium]|nr:AAA family ATPase [Dehalococcoidia bacterium]